MQQVEVAPAPSSRPVWSVPASVQAGRFHLRHAERRLLVGAGDIAALLLALAFALDALGMGRGLAALAGVPWYWLGTLVAIWLVVGPAFDSYAAGRLGHPLLSPLAVVQAGVATVAAYFLTPYLSAPLLNSRAVMLLFAGTLLAALILWRVLFALALGRLVAPRSVLVVGAGGAGQTIAQAIEGSRLDYRLVGFVDDRRAGSPLEGDTMVLGGREDLLALVTARGVTDVVIAEPTRMHADLVKAVVRAYESGVHVAPMSHLYETLTGRIPVEHVGDDWVGAMPQLERLGGLGSVVKRLGDLVGSAVGLAVLGALLPFVAVAVKLDSPGPVFYSQERTGLRGRGFRVWKFRSMVAEAEADGQARWAKPGDPRVTRVGRFLRSTRLDELPQMLNVLRGEMSLVGPRPERPAFVAALEQQIPFYRARLLVKPGITGWAQIKYRYGSSAQDALVKLQYDLYYVKHRSLMLDALILAKTVGVMLGLRGR